MPVAAEFVYLPPAGERASFTVVDGEVRALGEVLARLAPLEVRYDRRVDAYRVLEQDYPDWESLLFGEGLLYARSGAELHVRPRGVAPGEVELLDAGRAVGRWRTEPGETLEATLERWGERAGVAALYLTDRHYRLHRERVFEGPFEAAARGLLFSLSHLPHPPAGELAGGGRTLVVTHREPAAGLDDTEGAP